MRIIDYLLLKIKDLARFIGERDFFISAVIILVAFASFGLGRLSKTEETRFPVTVTESGVISKKPSSTKTTSQEKNYVASRNGEKYFLEWCSGAGTISPKNKITFTSEEEAKQAGYTPAANCPGLTP